MCHFTDQTTEAKLSKFDLVVLYSIRAKMGIIKSIYIKAFIKKNKKNKFSKQDFFFRFFFRFNLFLFLRWFLIAKFSKQPQPDKIYERYHKNGKDACTYKYFTQWKGYPLNLGSHESHRAIFHNYRTC